MKNKCTIIQISGLQGFLLVSFLILCLAAGFIVFPAWCCQHAWNYLAGFVSNMPVMHLKHGAMLWMIIVLVVYATFFSKLKVAFVPVDENEFDMKNIDDIKLLQSVKRDITNDIEKEKVNKEL